MQETTANKVAANATSSFTEHLQRDRPELLPYNRPLVVSETAGQPRLVDAFSLYSSGADPRGAAVADTPADADADRTLAARTPPQTL